MPCRPDLRHWFDVLTLGSRVWNCFIVPYVIRPFVLAFKILAKHDQGLAVDPVVDRVFVPWDHRVVEEVVELGPLRLG